MPVIDQDLLVRLRAAMKDPTSREVILEEMQNAQGPSLENALGRLGTAMQTARTPAGSAAAGVGGALGLGLGLLLRKRRKPSMDPMTNRPSDNPVTATQPPAAEPNLDRPAGSFDWKNATPVPAAQAWGNTTPSDTTPSPPSPSTPDRTSIPLTAGSRYMTGADERGNPVFSMNGGQTWQREGTSTDKTPVTGQIYNQSEIGTLAGTPQVPQALSDAPYSQILAAGGMRRGGRVRQFAGGGHAADDVLPPPKPPGRAVLMRHPMPVIHTTIVIAAKPKKTEGSPKKKPEKKAKGGPLKPAALPPKKGPESQGPPAPFKKGGHVQVPRGTGIAQRGKSFRGIY